MGIESKPKYIKEKKKTRGAKSFTEQVVFQNAAKESASLVTTLFGCYMAGAT